MLTLAGMRLWHPTQCAMCSSTAALCRLQVTRAPLMSRYLTLQQAEATLKRAFVSPKPGVCKYTLYCLAQHPALPTWALLTSRPSSMGLSTFNEGLSTFNGTLATAH